ncbi:MAG: hypothetical protein R3336_02940, partial [Phycisphaeraceae bacterium]|nr:hypothetical protein [Phycisphaeraceae bacterium]
MKPVSLLSAVAFAFSLTFSAVAGEIPEQLPRTTGGEPAEGKPVQVYILSGQSNMVGMGTIDGGGQRWGDEMIDPVLSVYPGPYDPNADYDEMDPIATQELEKFGGVKPTPFPGGGVQIVRGKVKMEESGLYRFKPGYRGSTVNIMEVDGKEVHRREPGGDHIYTPIQLEGGEAVPFKITYLTNQANGLGWTSRVDVPGTMTTLAKYGDKFPHLLDEDGNWLAREDVFYKGVVTSRGYGPMQIGVSGNTFGPEIGFGWVMGHLHDAPVLILKTSQGNRSLGWDFLPPGSKRYEHTDEEGTTWVHSGYKDSPARWEKGTEPEPINW